MDKANPHHRLGVVSAVSGEHKAPETREPAPLSHASGVSSVSGQNKESVVPMRPAQPTPEQLTSEREAVERIYQTLLARVIEQGAWLSGDERVTSGTACELLGYKPKRFANLCAPAMADPIPRTRAHHNAQATHHLYELAVWIYRRGT